MQKLPNIVAKVPKQGKIKCLQDLDLVAEHNAIVSLHGSVLFGRIGRSLAAAKIKIIRDAISEQLKPNLFLIRKGEADYEFFRAEILEIGGVDFTPDTSLCPSYYRELFSDISLWIQIKKLEKVNRDQLANLKLSSTGRPILDLVGTQASLMLAESTIASPRV